MNKYCTKPLNFGVFQDVALLWQEFTERTITSNPMRVIFLPRLHRPSLCLCFLLLAVVAWVSAEDEGCDFILIGSLTETSDAVGSRF